MKNTIKSDIFMHSSIFGWLAMLTGAILLIPLIAMRFSSEVNWTLLDFVTMGTLIFGVGSLFVFAARKFPQQRLLASIFFGLLFLYLWAELAVGLFFNFGS